HDRASEGRAPSAFRARALPRLSGGARRRYLEGVLLVDVDGGARDLRQPEAQSERARAESLLPAADRADRGRSAEDFERGPRSARKRETRGVRPLLLRRPEDRHSAALGVLPRLPGRGRSGEDALAARARRADSRGGPADRGERAAADGQRS